MSGKVTHIFNFEKPVVRRWLRDGLTAEQSLERLAERRANIRRQLTDQRRRGVKEKVTA